jgi:hypothetical protein
MKIKVGDDVAAGYRQDLISSYPKECLAEKFNNWLFVCVIIFLMGHLIYAFRTVL